MVQGWIDLPLCRSLCVYAAFMTNPDRTELIQLGITATLSGDLRRLRDRVHLSRNAQALLMDVTPDALRRWENAEQGMNRQSALRVGEWYWAAKVAIEDAEAHGINLDALVPLSTACQHLALSADEVEEKCQTGGLRCESLGVLGTYVYRTHIPSLNPLED